MSEGVRSFQGTSCVVRFIKRGFSMFNDDIVELIREEIKACPWRTSRIAMVTLSFVDSEGCSYQASWHSECTDPPKCGQSILGQIRYDLRPETPMIIGGNLMIALESANKQGQFVINVPLCADAWEDDDDDDDDDSDAAEAVQEEVASSQEEVKSSWCSGSCCKAKCNKDQERVEFPFEEFQERMRQACYKEAVARELRQSKGDICAQIQKLIDSLNAFSKTVC